MILIILATVSINAIFGENGLIKSAEKARIEHERGEAKERLDLVLADAYMEKHTAPEKYDENDYLDKFIYGREPDAEVAEAEISLNGYTFELDRSVPKLGEYIGEAGNLPPTIRNVKVIGKTETSAKIEVTVARGEGVKYKYSIKKASEGDESYTQAVEKEENTYEFTGLQAPNMYTAKVELIKDNQVVDTENIEILIGKLESGVVRFEEAVWKNGEASVKILTDKKDYTLQYQINGIESGSWKDITSGSMINGLSHDDTVYGRLWNGIDESDPASIDIKDEIAPVVSEIKTGEVTGDSIQVTVNAVDNESGLAISGTYKYYLDGTEKEASENNNYTFIELRASTEYTIKVEVYDKVGNKAEKSITVRTNAAEDSTAEAPAVAEGMTPVKWNGSNWVKTTKEDKDWYNYAEKKWANVVLGDATFSGDILDENKAYSMLVWIPRYAYQITSQYHQNGSDAGNINVVFIDKNNQNKNKTKTYKEEYPSYTTGSGMSDYVVHPAFNYDGKKLAGIWVGKYETSHTGCTTNVSTGQDNTNVTNKTAMIKAGVTSWRSIQVSNIFTVCTEMNKNGNPYGLNTSDTVVDPHMMKNSEWGAVAYLSKSKFGKETEEVWINPNSNYITGQAGSGVSVSSTTSTNAYNTTNGQKASTTGNVTGVYDMSGGAYEYTAAYVNNGNSNLGTYGSTLVNAAGKYKDVYSKGSSDNYEPNYAMSTPDRGHYGDAIWETSSRTNWTGSWYSDCSYFPYSSGPFFHRGGFYGDTSGAGVFGFSNYGGYVSSSFGFRVVVPVL